MVRLVFLFNVMGDFVNNYIVDFLQQTSPECVRLWNGQELIEAIKSMKVKYDTNGNFKLLWSLDKGEWLEDPNKPTPPLTAYQLFCRDKYPSLIIAKEPLGTRSACLLNMWGKASPNVLKYYEDLEEIDKDRYSNQMKTYVRPSDEEILKTKTTSRIRHKTAYDYFREIRKAEILSKNPLAKGYMEEINKAWQMCKRMELTDMYEQMAVEDIQANQAPSVTNQMSRD